VAEMPRAGDPNEKWQLIRNRHEETRRKLKTRNILPLTIIVTQTIPRCKEVSEELKGFLIEEAGVPADDVKDQILTVYNNATDVSKLPYIFRKTASDCSDFLLSNKSSRQAEEPTRTFMLKHDRLCSMEVRNNLFFWVISVKTS